MVHDTNFFDNGSTINLQAAGCWSLMHCQTEVLSSQKPHQGQDSQLTALIVQSKAEKVTCKVNKECLVFQHEDFGGQLIWALQCYVQVDIQGPEESFLIKKCRSRLLLLGRAAINTRSPHKVLQMLKMHPTPPLTKLKSFFLPFRTCWNLDNDDIIGAMVAAPMIDNDNDPAPENLPSTEDSPVTTNNIMGLWTHSGICQQKATIQCNAKPELTFWMSSLSNPFNLNWFKGLFFSSFIKTTILPQTNQNLPHGKKPILYGEFLHWIGLWMLMRTIVGPQGKSSR